MKRAPLRPGKKCRACNGSGCAACNQRGFTVKQPKPRKPVKAVKSKRHSINLQYGLLRAPFMLERPRCRVLGPSGPCGRPTTDLHHRKGRGRHMLDESTWMAVCAECHHGFHNQLRGWAARMGYIVNSASRAVLPPISATFLPYESTDR